MLSFQEKIKVLHGQSLRTGIILPIIILPIIPMFKCISSIDNQTVHNVIFFILVFKRNYVTENGNCGYFLMFSAVVNETLISSQRKLPSRTLLLTYWTRVQQIPCLAISFNRYFLHENISYAVSIFLNVAQETEKNYSETLDVKLTSTDSLRLISWKRIY